jgi:hypothetical protein
MTFTASPIHAIIQEELRKLSRKVGFPHFSACRETFSFALEKMMEFQPIISGRSMAL